jgi:undecaprenyl-diphosphatase
MNVVTAEATGVLGKALRSCQTIDHYLFERMAPKQRRSTPDLVFYCLSRSGDFPVYLTMTGLLAAFGNAAAYRFLLAVVIGFALELPLYKTMKSVLKRRRPCILFPSVRNAVPLPDYYSFPSGHTAGAFMVAHLAHAFFVSSSFPVYTWAVLVGYSRVYNRVHFPADVLAGALLGHACGMLAMLFV